MNSVERVKAICAERKIPIYKICKRICKRKPPLQPEGRSFHFSAWSVRMA